MTLIGRILLDGGAIALPPGIRLEVQIVLIAECICVSWTHIGDDRVVNEFGLANIKW